MNVALLRMFVADYFHRKGSKSASGEQPSMPNPEADRQLADAQAQVQSKENELTLLREAAR